MNIDANLIEELRARVQELENKVEALRISRRVLMNLIDSSEKEKREQLTQLETRNEKLQKNNSRYARALITRNIRITELEKQLQALKTGNNKTRNTFT